MTATRPQVESMLPTARLLARKHARRIADPAVTPDDLAQVAMLGVLKAARLYDGRGGWHGYATMQAEYALLHFLRDHVPGFRARGHGLVAAHLDAPAPGTDDLTLRDMLPAPVEEADHAQRLSLEAALARLPDGERALLTLHVVAGMSQAELGVALGVHQTNAGVRVRRALGRLRDMPDVQALAA